MDYFFTINTNFILIGYFYFLHLNYLFLVVYYLFLYVDEFFPIVDKKTSMYTLENRINRSMVIKK